MSKTIKVMSVKNGYVLTINNQQYTLGIFCCKEGANERAARDAGFLNCEVILA